MPDIKEVYEMVTQQTPPKPGALERQNRKQRRRSTRRKAGVYGLVAILMIVAGVLAFGSLAENDVQPGGSGPTPTPVPTPMPSSGALDPGTYVINTLDPDFDASHRITIDVADGYESFGGFSVLKLGAIQTSVSTWVVGNVYADGCDWIGALGGRPAGSSVDDLVVALASQRGLRASTPTDVAVDGFAGNYMERTVPAGTNLADCDGGEFRAWLDPTGGLRYLEPGQLDLLWIVDVDGVPLVIDAALDAGSSAQDRAELIRMVVSISIDPR